MAGAAFAQASAQRSEVSGQLAEFIGSARSYDALIAALDDWTERDDKSLAEQIAIAIFNADLLGRAQILADRSSDNPKSKIENLKSATLAAIVLDPDFEPLPFDEAIDYWRNKVSMSPSRFETLASGARAKAFTVAAGARAQVRDSIKDLIEQALTDGTTLPDFQKKAAAVLEAAGVAERTPGYWETVYRTNLSTAYQAGRWQQMTDPDVVSERPYLRYVSALLPTSRPSHKEKHGVILPHDDPFWSKWYPPNGFNCYCTVSSVSESLLKRRGWNIHRGGFRYDEPDDGFAGNVGKNL